MGGELWRDLWEPSPKEDGARKLNFDVLLNVELVGISLSEPSFVVFDFVSDRVVCCAELIAGSSSPSNSAGRKSPGKPGAEEVQSASPDPMESAASDQNELSAISVNDTAVLVTAVEDIFRYDASVTALMIIAYAVIFIMGLIGNAFVLGVVFRTPRMKTTTNYLLVNLAVADILVLLICVPANLIGNILLRESTFISD